MSNIVELSLSAEEAFELLEYLSESDYMKTETIESIIDELNYQLEGVEPLDFEDDPEIA